MKSDQTTLRERLCSIDTTYVMGDKTLQQFLPPNFYMDRLTEFVESYAQDKVQEELDKFFNMLGGYDGGTDPNGYSASIKAQDYYTKRLTELRGDK